MFLVDVQDTDPYVCITVKGSRVCEHCNVLAVRKYVRASMVQGYIWTESILLLIKKTRNF